MTIPTIASFFTPNWRYPEHAARLRRECTRLGLRHAIEKRPDLGGYLANCRQKPVFLAEVLERLGQPLLWVDVDGSVLRRPMVMPEGVDFMARPKPARSGRILHVGTLYIAPTGAGRELLRLWIAELADDSDEAALDRVWKAGVWQGAFRPLPPDYFSLRGPVSPTAVIRHRLSKSQAKREAHRVLRQSIRGLR